MKEIWKTVKGYEGLYEVSSKGKVRTVARYVKARHRGYEGERFLKQKELLPYKMASGYLIVALHKDGKYSQRSIHRLVAQAFIPNPDNLPCVNHRDENRANNVVENLEWCTYRYNDNYGHRNLNISNSRKGMVFSEEHRKNLSISHKKYVNDEFREKMRQVHLGKKLSAEHRRKISEGVRKSKRSKKKKI